MARDVYLRDASLALRGLVLIQLIGMVLENQLLNIGIASGQVLERAHARARLETSPLISPSRPLPVRRAR